MGRGGTSQGAGGGFNLNWDGAWQVRTAISDIGWSAEFAIPFRTIRFPTGRGQTWGLNVQRNIRRRNELAYWSPLPRQFDLFRVSMAGQLIGVEAPEGLWRTLQVTPYVVGEALRLSDTLDKTLTTSGAIGADLKYGVTSGLTLDLTYNTDFAQVEVDQQQLNLDRFSLFFPEKRPLEEIHGQLPVVFPVHPRTTAAIARLAGGDAPRLHTTEPLGYLDFLRLLADAKLVLTDSGGIQEETTVLGVPCLTLRDNTERPVTVSEGTNTVVGCDPATIRAEVRKVLEGGGKRGRIPEGWDGRAAQRIVDVLEQAFDTGAGGRP